MPRGPQGQKRPRDPNQLGKRIVDISVGEVEEEHDLLAEKAQRLGSKGGHARATKLTPEQRSEAARLAAAARWKKG